MEQTPNNYVTFESAEYITFHDWNINQEYSTYAIQLNGFYIGRLLIDHRDNYNHILFFDNKRNYTVKFVGEMMKAIEREFGNIDVAIHNN